MSQAESWRFIAMLSLPRYCFRSDGRFSHASLSRNRSPQIRDLPREKHIERLMAAVLNPQVLPYRPREQLHTHRQTADK
jgi:hypothetical protein